MINLDFYAAETGNKILSGANAKAVKPEDVDKYVTTAMNILAGQGIYAMFLWLDEKKHTFISSALNDLFHKPENPLMIRNSLPGHAGCQELTRNLEKMFLAKQLIDLSLTYARHMAKAQ